MSRCFSWLSFSLILAVLTSVAQTSAAPKNARLSPLEASLIADSRAVPEAKKNKDVDFLKRTLTDDFKEVGSEGKLHEKDDVLDDAHDGTLKDYKVYNAKVLPLDENAAIVTYDCVIHMPEGDPPGMAPRYQHISDLWVKQGEEWRLKFEQATAMRPID